MFMRVNSKCAHHSACDEPGASRSQFVSDLRVRAVKHCERVLSQRSAEPIYAARS
jgi:hypothetical protein